MKDNFSSKSNEYAQFRPHYPSELFRFLENLVPERNLAWDCGTGNGQVALQISEAFREVKATDISGEQLGNATKKENIDYTLQAAEKTNFPVRSFDFICVAQAIHWFDFEAFYAEVRRVLKPGGILAVIGYGLFRSNKATTDIIDDFYQNTVAAYWDPERRYLDEAYRTIPFPFKEVECPRFENQLVWDFDHLLGYLKTWSAVKHYENIHGENPVDLIRDDLKKAYGKQQKIVFPILLRVGKQK